MVRDDYQNKGIGTALLSYLTYLAKREGLMGFTAEVLVENKPMLHLFEKMGFDIQKTKRARGVRTENGLPRLSMSESYADIRYLFEPQVHRRHRRLPRYRPRSGTRSSRISFKADIAGKIYPVNPQGGEVLGLRAYRSVEEIGGEVDVARIVIPARFVFDAVKSCARKGVKYLTIISSGFSEIGNNEEEKRIVDFARENGMRVLGPNIFGIYSAEASLNATFGSSNVIPGGVAIITQSGALGIAMIGKTAVENIGLSAIVSVGNKTDVDEADLLEYLIQNQRTKIILMYIEGVRDGERLIQALKRVTEKIPVVVIKSGRSERGAIAAASHTGSLAGSDEIFDAIIRQCGVIRAESVEEAFDWCKFLANHPQPPGENTVIITNGAGSASWPRTPARNSG